MIVLCEKRFYPKILKDKLNHIWIFFFWNWAKNAIEKWVALGERFEHYSVDKTAKILCGYLYEILNQYNYFIPFREMGEDNKKISAIKQEAYSFHDLSCCLLYTSPSPRD